MNANAIQWVWRDCRYSFELSLGTFELRKYALDYLWAGGLVAANAAFPTNHRVASTPERTCHDVWMARAV